MQEIKAALINAFDKAKAGDNEEAVTRITRAIFALNAPADKSIFTPEILEHITDTYCRG